MLAIYVPDAGDLIWLDFDPQAGREQAGRRPALVLSAAPFNAKASLAFVCPITTRIKGYATEVPLTERIAGSWRDSLFAPAQRGLEGSQSRTDLQSS